MDQRTERMRTLIIQTFTDCLETKDFSEITVGELVQKAQINRSTFYRYFEDKYQLRDQLIDTIVSEFVKNLEVDFLDLDIAIDSDYTKTLQVSLENVYKMKHVLEILWNQKLLGRNVFEEMGESGAEKLESEILRHPNISAEKKKYSSWYARLLMNNMLVSIRWWFANHDMVTSKQITEMIKQHMIHGTIPTLKAN